MELDSLEIGLNRTNDGIAIRVKAVPGSSRTKVVGLLDDRLKVWVSAPPEGGRANRAVCDLISQLLGVPHQNVIIHIGKRQAQKTIVVLGANLCDTTERLSEFLNADDG
jgi:uncharacterized protein (TIGR00251 family)